MPDQAPPTGAPTGNPGAPVPATSPLDVNGPGELYVIFHGLFCFFDPPDSDTIVCQLPFIPMQMGGMGGMDGMQSMGFPSSDHVYRAGNFLAETELASGYYTLAGVKRGSKHFDRKNNLVIGAERPAEGTHFPAYATINVPRPEEIYSVNNIPLPTAADGTKVGFEGPDKGLVSGDFYATAHVFKYFYGDSATLKLAGPVKSLDHDWSTEKGNTIIKNDTTLSCSLHIIAEPDHLMVGHVGRAFSASMGLLQKSDSTTPDIQYQEIQRLPADQITQPIIPEGLPLIPAELYDMPTRRTALLGLGADLRRNPDAKYFFTPSAGVTTGDPERCGGVVYPSAH